VKLFYIKIKLIRQNTRTL